MSRCGKCYNCLQLEFVKRRVLACVNPPFSSATIMFPAFYCGEPGVVHTDYGVVNVWNTELERLPCLKEEP